MIYRFKIARRLALMAGLSTAVALTITSCDDRTITEPEPEPQFDEVRSELTGSGVVLVGAGSIAHCGWNWHERTAAPLDTIAGTVFTTGDHIENGGRVADYGRCYGSSWGRHRARTRPAPGDNDYRAAGGSAYFSYFGSAAGRANVGYYSYNLGAWHIVVLNSSIAMGPNSAQYKWLQADLAANSKSCTLAYWHFPRFSSSGTAVRAAVKPLWDALYAAGADVVLNGHERVYERFGPQTPAGTADAQTGIRQFTIGTGGQRRGTFRSKRPNSQVRWNGFGILKLTLSQGAYAWEFIPVGERPFSDKGSGSCHGAPGSGNAVVSVTVTPATTSVAVGKSVTLKATARNGSGKVVSNAPMKWISRDTLVARVSAAGLVTGVAAGSAVITATSGGLSDAANVTVTASHSPPSGCAPTGSGRCYYVDPASGSDSNNGSASAPLRTLARAAALVSPGDVVIARDGVYTGGSGTILDIRRSGTAQYPIIFRAEHKWRAVIDGRNNASSTGINIDASHVRVEGFEIRDVNHYGIEAVGSFTGAFISGNHIHRVGRYCTSGPQGLSAIDAGATDLVIEQNVIHNIGRYGPGENGCNPSNHYWQNHDHGLYIYSGSRITIRNNVFYDLTRGWAIHRYNGSGGVVDQVYIVNNTFAFPNPNREGHIIIASAMRNSLIANNIFYQPRTAAIRVDPASLSNITVSNNLTTAGSVVWGTLSGLNILTNRTGVNPLFANVGGFDFRLRGGSPAIDAGQALSMVRNDMDGTARPQGAGFDIGSHEYR